MRYTALSDDDKLAALDAAILAVERDHASRVYDRDRIAAVGGDVASVTDELDALETRHRTLLEERKAARTGK